MSNVSADEFTIVVLGNMNPSVHHPLWYLQVGLFQEDEVLKTLHEKEVICIPPLTKFSINNISMQCTQENWQIGTSDKSNLPYLESITAKVFDDLLKHTPVDRMGFNFNYRRDTASKDVAGFLANRLAEVARGLGMPEPTAAELILRRRIGEGTAGAHVATTVLKPGSQPSSLLMTNNHEFVFKGGGGFFDLGGLISSHFHASHAESEANLARILGVLNSTGGGDDGSAN